jgi:hypothetical protein
MFSLLVTIISIALVAILALASFYYGGPLFEQGSVTAHTSQLMAEATQIQGAVQLFYAENGRNPTGPAELTANGEWLKEFPQSWGGGPSYLATTPTSAIVSQQSCILFNQRRLGISTIPSCSDPVYTNKVVCCESDPVFAE